ncbi:MULTISPECIES: hypothetical protein [Agrobacterium]|nr:hypothetical protein [Agrobacterium larrymoorei]
MSEPIIYGKPEPLAALDHGVVKYSEELHGHTEENILCRDGRIHYGTGAFWEWFDGTASDDNVWCGYFDNRFNKGPVHPNDWYWAENERRFIEMATLSDEDFLAVAMSNSVRITIHEQAC